MSRTVIAVEGLSKRYRLGAIGANTFGDDIRRWIGKESPGKISEMWALRGVDMEVKEGEILGVIGKNGAGKSTLLKLLSRITSPTEGRIKLRGRMAGLLEVGTGMHPELSGRENIFLNGAILGMSRREVARKFDDIVAFAEVERFIDTPIKRYSSGMKVRLGFAVAAFLDAELLVVDEVLAVGDEAFQRRALGAMRDLTQSTGRTVVFVSHNMRSVSSLCTRAILLDGGRIRHSGPPKDTLAQYLEGHTADRNSFVFEVSGIRVEGHLSTSDAAVFEDSDLRFVFRVSKAPADCDITLNFKNRDSEVIATASSLIDAQHASRPAGDWTLACRIPKGFFIAGRFYIDVSLVVGQKRLVHREENAFVVEILGGKKAPGSYHGNTRGYVLAPFRWSAEETL